MKDFTTTNKFPEALVSKANSFEDVLAAWKNAGLKELEVSEGDLKSEIKIEASKHTGEMKWTAKKADGLRVLSMMAVAMKDMYKEYLTGAGRSKLGLDSPDTKVLIQLQDGKVEMAYDQTQDPMVVKGLLMACLWRMIAQIDDGHPLDVFTGLLEFEIDC